MDHLHSHSFPGFGCLLALLTLWFVPYGVYLLAFVFIVFLLSGLARLIYQVSRMLSDAWQLRTAAGRLRA